LAKKPSGSGCADSASGARDDGNRLGGGYGLIHCCAPNVIEVAKFGENIVGACPLLA